MKLAKELDFLGDLSSVALETTVVVVKFYSTEMAQHAIENSARQDFVPWIMTNFFPAADAVSYTHLTLPTIYSV